MGKYYIKQSMISINDRYRVYNMDNELILKAGSNYFGAMLDRLFGSFCSLGYTLTINDLEGKEHVKVKKKLGGIWKRYDIIKNNEKVASLNQCKTWFKPKLNIISIYDNYSVAADILAKSFSINTDNDRKVAEVFKKVFNLTDMYEIYTYDEDIDEIIIPLVLVLDNCWHN